MIDKLKEIFSNIEFAELADSALDKGKELLSAATDHLSGFDYSQLMQPELLPFWGGAVAFVIYLLIKEIIGFFSAAIIILALGGAAISYLNV
ncbi:TPA: hypothetical protein ACPVZG_000331 [Vibrio parahaemolyticus]